MSRSKKYEIIKGYSDKETKKMVKDYCDWKGQSESQVVNEAVKRLIRGRERM